MSAALSNGALAYFARPTSTSPPPHLLKAKMTAIRSCAWLLCGRDHVAAMARNEDNDRKFTITSMLKPRGQELKSTELIGV